ncbi:MAG: glycosyltransferase family 4 protein [Acidimicrobiales bacterium]
MKHLLVTNDFPPKVGGIQNYLWELWRRLPSESTTVLTTSYKGAAAFDAQQPIRIERDRAKVMLPTKALARRIDALAAEVDADLILLDPAIPLGIVGPQLERPYGVILHGAEVTVPGRIPIASSLLRRVLRGASVVVAAGGYPAAEAQRCAERELPTIVIPPGVDTQRFLPLTSAERCEVKARLGFDPDALLVVGLSRLVPRKGFDVLIDAAAIAAEHFPTLQVAIAGSGRDRNRLERIARRVGSPVQFLGRVDDADIAPLLGCGDVFAMLCRDRWAGLEQEGFGIVFLEASSCSVPVIAGRSGGSAEAVVDESTGIIVDDPTDAAAVAETLERLLRNELLRHRMGEAGRSRAQVEFTHSRLATFLHQELERIELPK